MTVTMYSPAGAPSLSAVVVRVNVPSGLVVAYGRVGSVSFGSVEYRNTVTPPTGCPLIINFPSVGKVGFRFGPPHETAERVRTKRTAAATAGGMRVKFTLELRGWAGKEGRPGHSE